MTRHERGIALSLLEGACFAAGFGTSHKSLSLLPALPKLAAKLRVATYNSSLLTRQVSLVCRPMSFNTHYHRTSTLSKIGPSCVHLVLEMRAPLSLEFSLAADGWNVEVVTRRMRYDDRHCKLSVRDTVNSVLVHRVPTSRLGRG